MTAEGSSRQSSEVTALKRELVGLFDHIQRMRTEIASIRHPDAEEDYFTSMADQLDAITQATEQATDTIMESVEAVEDVHNQIRQKTDDPEIRKLLDQAGENTIAVFEACSFQDITGQRVSKIVESLKFVEERVNALIAMWGRHKLANIPTSRLRNKDEGKEGDRAILHGPQREVSQDNVDNVLGDGQADQASIDALFDGGGAETGGDEGGGEAAAAGDDGGGEASQADVDAMFDGGGGGGEASQADVDAMFDGGGGEQQAAGKQEGTQESKKGEAKKEEAKKEEAKKGEAEKGEAEKKEAGKEQGKQQDKKESGKTDSGQGDKQDQGQQQDEGGGESNSQDDIDKLFGDTEQQVSQDDIDKLFG